MAVGVEGISIRGIETAATPTAVTVAPTRLALLGSLPLACLPPAPADTCYVDAHCGDGMVCLEGLCGMPEAGSDDGPLVPDGIKLDVGGEIPEIPASCDAALSIRTNAGCEFWAVDLPNAWLANDAFGHDIAADQQFAVVVANVSETEVALVSVYSGAGAQALATSEVAPLSTHTFPLPEQSIDPTKNSVGTAYRVVSDVPITAYQFNPLDNLVPVYSNDASALLPSHVLENDHIAVTSDALRLLMYPPGAYEPTAYDAGAFVTIVATVDGTHLALYPTAEVDTSGTPWNDLVLARGEAYTVLSVPSGGGNLSGTRVVADHPVAVFAGNVSASEPRDTEACCADHVEHQMLPLVAWGSEYIAPPPPMPGRPDDDVQAVYRITAGFDGTKLEYPGGAPAGAPTTLDASETASFVSAAPLIVRSDTEHPFALAQFLVNTELVDPAKIAGDPALVIQPSLAQLQTRYVFLSPAGYRESVVTVFAPADATVAVDGRTIDRWRQLPAISGDTWKFARVAIAPGAHAMVSDRPAGIDVYGYDRNVSYAYAGGSAVAVISEAPPIP